MEIEKDDKYLADEFEKVDEESKSGGQGTVDMVRCKKTKAIYGRKKLINVNKCMKFINGMTMFT
jgi:hypothetical protein